MVTNSELYDAALRAIDELFADRSVNQSQARENLENLRDEIYIRLDSLKEDE